jgi:hypothetical protein
MTLDMHETFFDRNEHLANCTVARAINADFPIAFEPCELVLFQALGSLPRVAIVVISRIVLATAKQSGSITN